jgi:hypothetical protein
MPTVFPRIRRRTAEFLKEAVPGLLDLGRFSRQGELDSCSEEIGNDTSTSDGHLLSTNGPLESMQKKVLDELLQLAKMIKSICDSVQVSKA